METKHLSYFKVENFKRFDSLEVNDIGQFNLIVGDNNVGKTSLLEALLFDDENYDQFLSNIANALLFNRRINIPEDVINCLDYYLKNKKLSTAFDYKYGDSQHNILLNKAVLNDLTDEEIQGIGKWQMRTSKTRHLIRFNFNGTVDYRFATMQFLLDDGEWSQVTQGYFPFIGLNSNYNYDVFNFSKISISTSKLDSLQQELKYLLPNLVSIELNNAVVPNTPTITIRETNSDLKPLFQYGDGVIKLFKYLLELELYENKRLMIDEIDTGIHYSRMKEFLKKVLQSAKNKNVQIFATTHSKECLTYYTEALQELEYQKDGRIIRLADTRSGIKAYSMRFAEFENALDAENEIR